MLCREIEDKAIKVKSPEPPGVRVIAMAICLVLSCLTVETGINLSIWLARAGFSEVWA